MGLADNYDGEVYWMRKTINLLAVFVLLLLTSLLVGAQTVKAQYTPDGQGFPLASPISILSPSNNTYSSNLLTLNVTFKILLDPSNAEMVYSIDGKNNATLPIEATFVPIEAEIVYANGTKTTGISIQSYYLITGWATLPEMPEGSHSITVYGKYEFPGSYHNIGLDNRTVYFTVNDGTPPVISNLSLENKTYNQSNLPLNFTTDEPTSWMGFCLDGEANATITGNATLTELSDGSHTLTIYANDTVGNMGVSETIIFTVVKEIEPLPTTVVVVSAVSVTSIGLSVLVCFRKRIIRRICFPFARVTLPTTQNSRSCS